MSEEFTKLVSTVPVAALKKLLKTKGVEGISKMKKPDVQAKITEVATETEVQEAKNAYVPPPKRVKREQPVEEPVAPILLQEDDTIQWVVDGEAFTGTVKKLKKKQYVVAVHQEGALVKIAYRDSTVEKVVD